ncbi:MAG: hypothetical protein J5747_07650 [Spirochaetaceae bacterium]|nr:hypothetical protein [Spirochaetaceae bacterium]
MNKSETFGLVIYIVSILCCSGAFVAVGIYSFKRKDPMNFWTFSNVPAEKVSDIPGYNRANGKMWFVAAIVTAANIPFAFYNLFVAGMVLVAMCAVGLPCLIITYNKICKKYFV